MIAMVPEPHEDVVALLHAVAVLEHYRAGGWGGWSAPIVRIGLSVVIGFLRTFASGLDGRIRRQEVR